MRRYAQATSKMSVQAEQPQGPLFGTSASLIRVSQEGGMPRPHEMWRSLHSLQLLIYENWEAEEAR